MSHEVLLSYTAALVDGEGTVTLTRNKSNENRRPVVSITSTSRALIDFLLDEWGGKACPKKKGKSHHKQAWHWVIESDAALLFLRLVIHYMKEPIKIARADFLIRNYKNVTRRNGRYSQEQLEAKQQFEKRFFELQG